GAAPAGPGAGGAGVAGHGVRHDRLRGRCPRIQGAPGPGGVRAPLARPSHRRPRALLAQHPAPPPPCSPSTPPPPAPPAPPPRALLAHPPAAPPHYHWLVPDEETPHPGSHRPGARALAGRAAAAVLDPSPAAMRMFALAGVVCTAGVIATGAAVRLSASGLGCPDWPECTRNSLVAAHSAGDPMVHTWIEFGNRLVTVAITVIAVVVFVAGWRFRPGGRRRRDLVWLAAAQPPGIVAQALLGGIVVLPELTPAWVALPCRASMAVLAAAVALHVRCTEGQAPARSLVRADLRLLAYAVLAAVALMLAAGTVVTGTGPLAGAGAAPRFHLPLAGATQFHADIRWLLGGPALPLAVRVLAARPSPRARPPRA